MSGFIMILVLNDVMNMLVVSGYTGVDLDILKGGSTLEHGNHIFGLAT